MIHKCETCRKKIDFPSDYCAECGKNLCDECMKKGCCGSVPAKSGADEDNIEEGDETDAGSATEED